MMNMNIDMKLKSFPAFAELHNSIQLHKEALKSVVDTNQDKLEQLQAEYSDTVLQGGDVAAISKSMKIVKADLKHAKEELEFVHESDLRLPHLARSVYDDFREVEKEVQKEINDLFQQSEQIKENAIKSIRELRQQAEQLVERFGEEVVHGQFMKVAGHLADNQDSKNSLIRRATHGLGVSNWVQIDGRHC